MQPARQTILVVRPHRVSSMRADYRGLFDSLHTKDRRPLYTHVLVPWVEVNSSERNWLRSFASRSGSPIPPAADKDLWRQYALGRVNEVLLLCFQRGRADGTDWPGPKISPDEYVWFAESVGLTVAKAQPFSPFYHEVVEVDQADDEEQPVTLLSTFWPCLMLGNMMFSRAGVRASGGRRFIREEVAESSTLYWAYRRKNRPYQDLSHSWGSNSQWRTRFRRDYLLGRAVHYNVDGKHDLFRPESRSKDRDGLTSQERIELLTNRCFITATKAHGDLWPYDDRYQVTG